MDKGYTPLYPPYGGPPRGFACELEHEGGGRCTKLTTTEAGMRRHVEDYHGVELQPELFEKKEGE